LESFASYGRYNGNTGFFTGFTFPLISVGFSKASLSFIGLGECHEQKQLHTPLESIEQFRNFVPGVGYWGMVRSDHNNLH
jgi:hypothetical protein